MKRILFHVTAAIIMLGILNSPAGAAKAKDELLLGLIPEENIFTQMKRHRPLAQYLTKKLDIKVKLTVLSRYPHLITRFERRELDGAFFGIFTSVLAEESLNIEPVARPVGLDGKSTATSYIFTRTDSGINTLKDLKGKKAAFVDKVTATGYLYMLSRMMDKGISNPLDYLSGQTLTGSHVSAIYTVHSRQADVGCAKGRIVDMTLENDKLLKDEIKIIDKSPELPDNTLYIRKDLPIQLKLKMQQVLLDMEKDPEGRKILEHYGASRFIDAKSSDFYPIRKMARQIGINIKKFKYDYQ
ncbi:phosphate/phosphite/phosphonate ABC transporter substrate-binding protein [Nitrospirota bacterium]